MGRLKAYFSRFEKLLHRTMRSIFTTLVKGLWWPTVALIAVLICWLYFASGIPTPLDGNLENFGTYGDSFGKITSLFTALGFGGLIITLLLQQRQIRQQEFAAKIQRERDEKFRYEEVLFRLMDTYRQTLSEVQVGSACGRAVLRHSAERIDIALQEDGAHTLPGDLLSKQDMGKLSTTDMSRIDYLHYRNFKIVAAEILPQARLVDTFEVLLKHMYDGAPKHLLIDTYRDLVFAQITFIESRYFFLVALSHTSRSHLRELLARTGFLKKVPRSVLHKLHRDMYLEYWGQEIEVRDLPPSIPMSSKRIGEAFRAHRAAGGVPTKSYTPLGVRKSRDTIANGIENTQLPE